MRYALHDALAALLSVSVLTHVLPFPSRGRGVWSPPVDIGGNEILTISAVIYDLLTILLLSGRCIVLRVFRPVRPFRRFRNGCCQATFELVCCMSTLPVPCRNEVGNSTTTRFHLSN